MHYFGLLAIALLPACSMASSRAPTPAEFEALLELDYQAFDQDRNGGFRAIRDDVEAGKVLDAYGVHNSERLTPAQTRIILWHAGQSYGFANLNKLALARFKRSFEPSDGKPDLFRWNSYVKGTIAFMEKDRARLAEAIDELREVNKIEPNGNLRFLESLQRCFDRPYLEAYNPNCK